MLTKNKAGFLFVLESTAPQKTEHLEATTAGVVWFSCGGGWLGKRDTRSLSPPAFLAKLLLAVRVGHVSLWCQIVVTSLSLSRE